ncbi:hypothetical protein JSY36_05645 [Bacillus sp. H-16]|nr:hypothetical protein [Alteribacter salitolerans]
MTNHTWTISPPAIVLWLFAAASLVLGIFGFNYKPDHVAKVRNWTTVTLSSLLCIVLFLGVLRFLFISEELMKTEHSPDEKYTINFYLTNGGATTAFGVIGKNDGPLWFNKTIYNEYRMDKADVEWLDDHTVTINGRTLDLEKGETYPDS